MYNSGAVKASAPTASLLGTPENEIRLATAFDSYQNEIKSARRGLAYKLVDALNALDDLTEKEFLEIVKTLDNGVTASDLLERFRKYKETGRLIKRKRKSSGKPKEKKQESPF